MGTGLPAPSSPEFGGCMPRKTRNPRAGELLNKRLSNKERSLEDEDPRIREWNQVTLPAPPGRTERDVVATAIVIAALTFDKENATPLHRDLVEAIESGDLLPEILPSRPFDALSEAIKNLGPSDPWPSDTREGRKEIEARGVRDKQSRCAPKKNEVRLLSRFVAKVSEVLKKRRLWSPETLRITGYLVLQAALPGGKFNELFGVASVGKKSALLDAELIEQARPVIKLPLPDPLEPKDDLRNRLMTDAYRQVRKIVRENEAHRARRRADYKERVRTSPEGRKTERENYIDYDYFVQFVIHQDPGVPNDQVKDRLGGLRIYPDSSDLLHSTRLVARATGIARASRRPAHRGGAD